MRTPFKKIYYKFCQELKILIPLGALLIFFLNTSLSKDTFTATKESVLLNKNLQTSQSLLINLFLVNNQFQTAAALSNRAIGYSASSPETETFVNLRDRAKNFMLEEAKITNEINYWGSLSNRYPSYRDSFIKLAILSLKTNRLFEAKKNINLSLVLDPNFEVSKKILEVITKN